MDEIPGWALRLRAERRERLWSQRQMARALAEVADESTRAHLPTRESLIRMIKDWEKGQAPAQGPLSDALLPGVRPSRGRAVRPGEQDGPEVTSPGARCDHARR